MYKNQNHLGFTTVVDQTPRFWCEFVLWLHCANAYMPGPKRVYFIGTVPDSLVDFAKRHGCDVRHAETLLPESPHCNKLIPFLDEDGFPDQIVTDCDVFLTADISPLFDPERVRLAPNNHARPPLPVFRELFKMAGIDKEPEPGLALFKGGGGIRETFQMNVSAGVICIPEKLKGFAIDWKRQAEWLITQRDYLQSYATNTDQIAFALAAAETELPFTHLPAQANTILHLLPLIETLMALHLTTGHISKFPKYFNQDKTLNPESFNSKLTEYIEPFNAHVALAKQDIDRMVELHPFRESFLNPAYKRPPPWSPK